MSPAKCRYIVVRPFSAGAKICVVKVLSETVDYYMVTRIPCEDAGEGFSALRFADTDIRHVRMVGLNAGMCDCQQGSRRGFCRHVFLCEAARSQTTPQPDPNGVM